MADESQDECFIVGVIGKDGSEQRVHADWFIDGIVIPVFAAHFPKFRVLRADRMQTPGMITSQIIQKLLEAKLVIADMSFLNANAFYEMGIRHMTGLPIIHAHREAEPIPFDVSPYLSMSYSTAQHSQVMAAQAALKTLVTNVLAEGYEVENPVTQARGRVKFDETASPADRVLLQELKGLSARVMRLEESDMDAQTAKAFDDDMRTSRNRQITTLHLYAREGAPSEAVKRAAAPSRPAFPKRCMPSSSGNPQRQTLSTIRSLGTNRQRT